MSDKNSYFQLKIKDGVTYLVFFPPEGNGEELGTSEVINYLNKHQIEDVDLHKINSLIVNLGDSPREIVVCEKEIIPERESLTVKISEDKMTAVARFYPPSTGGMKMTIEDIVTDLAMAGIKYGIQKEIIEDFLKDRKYCTDYEVALGKLPVQGTDASIEYLFNTNLSLRPKENEDGSVDYHHLDAVARVEKGQLLARLIPDVPGIPGKTVTGDKIPAQEVKRLKLKYGKNIERSADKCTLTSMVNGHAYLVEDCVYVSNIYEVTNVDNSTGDILYDGNVLVRGNVCSGFTVRASGNIEVEGVVEGAKLVAGGDILIKRGIQGMGKANLHSNGDLIAQFIENAEVFVGGSVRTDTILHSKISAKGDIEVMGKKGFIAGGVVRSTNLINAKTIGSPMGTVTIIEVGVDPLLKERLKDIEKENIESDRILETAKPVVVAFGKRMGTGTKLNRDQMMRAQMLQRTIDEHEKRLVKNKKEKQEIEKLLELETEASVRIKKNLYPGTRISIGEAIYFVKARMGFCYFTREDGEVKWHTM